MKFEGQKILKTVFPDNSKPLQMVIKNQGWLGSGKHAFRPPPTPSPRNVFLWNALMKFSSVSSKGTVI